MSQFSEVIQLVRKEQVTLFLGAGFSLEAGAPTRHTLFSDTTFVIRENS